MVLVGSMLPKCQPDSRCLLVVAAAADSAVVAVAPPEPELALRL